MLTFGKDKVSFNGSFLFWILKMTVYYSLYLLLLQTMLLNCLLAASIEGQNLKSVKITLSVHNITLEQALEQIEKSTDFNFVYNKDEIPLNEIVSIDVSDETLYSLLSNIAGQHDLAFQRINHQIVFKKSKIPKRKLTISEIYCKVTGKITDAATNEPLIGANVLIKGTNIGATSDANGDYFLKKVEPGSYTLVFGYVGYITKTEPITVVANRTMELNVALEQGAYNLNEVTVTGSVSDRKIKESANPITILTPRDLENRNLNSLGTVLQTVPGVVASKSVDVLSVAGRINDGSLSNLNIRGFSPGSTSGSTKFLVDGVEIYNFRTLAYIDPNQIEKIEVTRGPMSSTLYGAGSSGGIVQIFTKKGAGKLKVNFKTVLTSKESKYQDSNPLITEYAGGLNGGTPDFGYTLSFDYQRHPISRAKENNGIPEQDWVASARINGTLSNVKVDLNVRYSKTEVGSSVNRMWYKIALADGWENPEYLLSTSTLSDGHNRNTGTNLNLILRQPLTNYIYHNLSLGISNISATTDIKSPSEINNSVYYSGSEIDYKKSSAKYFINMSQQISSDFKIDITGGGEYIQTEAETFRAGFLTPYDDNGSQDISPEYNYGGRSFSNNVTTGLFAEAVWGYNDKLFLTTGFRAEKNSSYGDNTGWYKTPRIGLTYIIEASEFTFKPRMSWGKSTQPVRETYKLGKMTTTGQFTFIYLPNPDLEPETQEGYEIGTDVFFTNNYSFGITYYNQKVANLMETVKYPSDDLYTTITQYVNVANVLNRGFELSAKAVFNDFTINTSGTISMSKYGGGFPESSSSDIKAEGNRVVNIPSGTFFASISYRFSPQLLWSGKGGNINVSYMWRGSAIDYDYYDYFKSRTETGSGLLEYKEFDGYYTINSRADYWVFDNLSLFVDVINLLNNQDIVGGYPRSGRRISFGFNCNL